MTLYGRLRPYLIVALSISLLMILGAPSPRRRPLRA